MDIAESNKITFLVCIYLRAILGKGEETDIIISEVLADDYTHEKMRVVISDSKKMTKNIIAVLAGNGTVCNALNCMPGSSEDKLHIISNRLWGEFIGIMN